VFLNRYAETFTERAFGRAPLHDLDDLEGEVFYPDGRVCQREDWPIIRATRGEKVADQQLVYRLPDGRSVSFRVSTSPVYGPDGDIVAAVAVGRDVTEHGAPDSASLERGL
jgi:PAS domain-containing protein